MRGAIELDVIDMMVETETADETTTLQTIMTGRRTAGV